MTPWLAAATLAGALAGVVPVAVTGAGDRAVGESPASGSGEPRVVLLPLEVEGPLADSWRGELHQALLRGLADGRLAVVPEPEGSTDGCREPSCLAVLSQAAGAEGVIRARIAVVERDYEVVIELLDARGTTIATSEEGCSVCGMAEVVALVRGQAAALRGRLIARTLEDPVLEIRSTPPGAEVRVDGVQIGVTPLRRSLSAGSHRVELSSRGYATEVREVDATAGVRETLDVTLLVDDAPRRRRRIAGWSLGGVGLGAATAGAVLWGIDSRPATGERCRGDDIDAAGHCRYLYDTRAVGIAVLAAGVAVLATGVGLLVSGRRARPARTARRRAIGLVLR
ncbi:MAG: PEGA domain-containing protein [Myxococcales bacterium]|nr:PEGA domain-containing protein [Myxococcales bacterium]